MTDLDAQIEAVNQKLREEGIPRPAIVRRGQKLYLRGTFPPPNLAVAKLSPVSRVLPSVSMPLCGV